MTKEFAKHRGLIPTEMNNGELWTLARVLLKELHRRSHITGQLHAIEAQMEKKVEAVQMGKPEDREAHCGCCGALLREKAASGSAGVVLINDHDSSTTTVACWECIGALAVECINDEGADVLEISRAFFSGVSQRRQNENREAAEVPE